MKQQMLELCRSDTLSRARDQHDRDLAVIKQQHEVALLAIQQKLDSTSQALDEQVFISTVTRCSNGKLECYVNRSTVHVKFSPMSLFKSISAFTVRFG